MSTKMNYERNYTHIFRTVKLIAFFSVLFLAGAFAAELKVEEASTSYTYQWELTRDELTEFVKTGQLNSGISGNIYYQGRYYPIYTIILENKFEDLSYVINKKNIIEINTEPLISRNVKNEVLSITPGQISINDDIASPEESLINNREHQIYSTFDQFDPSKISDFVTLNQIPGIGTLVEIMPCLPQENGSLHCLQSAEIKLISTGAKSLKRSTLDENRTQLAKVTSLKNELPEEFCALYIEEAGVYQVSGQDLSDLGIDIRYINPDNLKLFWWGEELPCRVTSTYESGVETFQYHDVIQFFIPEKKNPYGDYKYNPFSDYDVLHLYWNDGNGLRYIQENSEIDASIPSENKFMPEVNRTFRSTIHIEKNELYQNLARLHEDELSHKYEHEFFNPSIRIGRSVAFPFELWDPVLDSPYNVNFTLRMQGLTYSVDDEMDHQILVSVNNQYMLEDEWDGQVPKISTNFDMQYNHENLNHGENAIEISVKGFESNPYLDDQVLFDWLEVSYDRYMIAHNNRLSFSPQHGPGTYMFEIQGLSSATDVLILKNQTNWIRGYFVEEKESSEGEISYSIYFEDLCDGTETYQVAGPGMIDTQDFGIESLDSIRYVNTATNEQYNYNTQGNYVIVSGKHFFEKAKDLVDHKADMGFIPVIYELERIYDEYNYGNESPYAIKAFLKDIYNQWSITPQYVLFIGDTGTENSLPIIKYQSSGAIGAVIAENWFVDIDDDFVIEMALGRIPVSTVDELDSVIAKIIVFDEMPVNKQRNRMALLAGPGNVFKTQIQNYLNGVSPDRVQTDRLYLYDSHVTGDFDEGAYSTDSLVNYIRDGVFCINYMGHGGGYTWDNHVLPYTSFEDFVTDKPFIVNSLTCYTNTFSNDNALGEMFVRHPKGAISVLSSTGYGWVNSNYFIYEKLMHHMFEDKMSHGKALRFALNDYFFSTFGRNANFIDNVDGRIIYKYFRKTLFYQMCILGDPSATFPINKEGVANLSQRSLSSGQTINIATSSPGITRGLADLVGTRDNGRKYPIKQKIDLVFNQGNAQLTVPVLHDDIFDGILQLTYWDEAQNTYAKDLSLSYNSPYIKNLNFFPETPNLLDTAVYIRIELESDLLVDSLSLRVYASSDVSSSYKKLKMESIENNIYQSTDPVIYQSKTSFYTVDTSLVQKEIYSGIYFMPEITLSGEIITGDYYTLIPQMPVEYDISIVDYSIESGKSQLILFNETDTNVYVKVNMSVESLGSNYIMTDTVLCQEDVDGQYESGYEKVNTYYYDFLPAFGSENIQIEIEPLTFEDTDTTNNKLLLNVDNKWLRIKNDELYNYSADTLLLTDCIVKGITVNNNASYTGSVYVDDYSRAYDLSEFGASLADSNILYVNSTLNEIDLLGFLPTNKLAGDKFIAYLSADLEKMYRLPLLEVDSMSQFSIISPGYYCLVTSTDNVMPEIELNINARELLTRGFVSERSDFSVIVTDDHGVNPLPEYWSVLLDDEEIPEEDVMIIESDDISQFILNFKLEMQPDEHVLQVVAHDLVGNRTETDEYEIIYNEDAQLIDYGTFPNPFTTRTTFIYELTEQFDDVTIKIFTLSGKKIFTMSVSENAITDLPLYSIGYHEIPWYGRDEFGNTVANGVYFYIIEGEVNDKKVKSTGKIAKLR